MNKKNFIATIIGTALREDMGAGDITTNVLVSKNKISTGQIICRQKAVVSGLNLARQVFEKADKTIQFRPLAKDGEQVPARAKLAVIKGKTRNILKAERVALNFLSHLSAIATQTRGFVRAATPYKVQIMDTRKTTPGLRVLERQAVRDGGGINHRFNLNDMVLIKDNHLAATRHRLSIAQVVRACRQKTKKPVQIEVETLSDLKEALDAGPDFILLDNMSPRQVRQAVAIRNRHSGRRKIQLEASGGINLSNVRRYAQTGIDRISVGALTHSKQAVDVSLELT